MFFGADCAVKRVLERGQTRRLARLRAMRLGRGGRRRVASERELADGVELNPGDFALK